MLERAAWAGLIPHQGRMALIERVLSFDQDVIHAESENHRDPDHPLRRDGRLHAVHLCEYGAQAMAVHGALSARERGDRALPGLLVALRGVRLAVERLDDLGGPLAIHAHRVSADPAAWLYAFRVLHGEDLLAEGQAMVMLERADD